MQLIAWRSDFHYLAREVIPSDGGLLLIYVMVPACNKGESIMWS